MERFAALLDALVYTRSRNGKLALIADYLRRTPDPDRGWALAALTGGLDFPAVKSAVIRNLLTERVDPVLYALSRDYVGDSAETASLLWPEPPDPSAPPSVSEAVDTLAGITRATVVREPRATFSLAIGQPARPGTATEVSRLYLAGDWIDTGLPATIESAARSGHRAAEAIESGHLVI